MKNIDSQVLVLGATGMLGRIVYRYLVEQVGRNIQGASRNRQEKNLVHFNFKKPRDLENLFKKNNYSFAINCIGSLKESLDKKLELLNTILPNALLRFSKKYNFKIVNISTDAVFSSTAGHVYETSITNPDESYGKSKLKGELSKNAINIRTSILGFDPIEHKGLLEFLLKNKNNKITGFTNQKWAGSTTLQLSQFIKWLISGNNFNNLLKKTKVIHFAPIGPVTKYEILKTFSKLTTYERVIKKDSTKQTRILKTIYIDEINLKKYTKSLEKALKELIDYEKISIRFGY